MLVFTAWFAAYSLRRHDAQMTHRADLGQIDQAIWNTAYGRLLQEIKGDQISTRLTDHVEPIFVPVSLVLRLWDDVRALLILQTLMLAAGAWPIYLFARKRLNDAGAAREAGWGGVVFAAAYLLTPALQAAAVSEFHALPLAAPFAAASIWAVERRKWGWFVVWAVLVAACQEGTALLAATLGLYAVIFVLLAARRSPQPALADLPTEPANAAQHAAARWETGHSSAPKSRQLVLTPEAKWGFIAGATVCLIGLAWFYLATFVIIPRYAAVAYGTGATPYAARYGTLGDSFGDVLVAMVTRPFDVLRIVTEPLRLQYLFGLLIPTAGLALLGPELLLVSLPLLLANLLSSFPLQYSGELHYSAPLAVFFTMAAAIGTGRFIRRLARDPAFEWMRGRVPAVVLGAVLVCSLGYQIADGFAPMGREFRLAGGWPRVTAHDALLARFAAAIPADASLSTTPSLHPHLSHRERIYLFPTVGNADYVLVDVAGTTDRQPTDVKASLEGLLASGEFGVADAADGYLLLERGAAAREVPAAFADFVRAQGQPQYPLDITFGDALKLVGYDLVDDPKWRQTRLRFYWSVLKPLPADTAITYRAHSPAGEVVDDAAARPMPALLWHPPSDWQPGETIMTETLPWYLPRTWAPVLSVSSGGQQLWPTVQPVVGASEDVEVSPAGETRLPAWIRQKGSLIPMTDPAGKVEEADAAFAGRDWTVRLTGWNAPIAMHPGAELPVSLRWASNGPAPRDYSVFLHLRDATGKTVASGDAGPGWFVSRPPSAWPQAVAGSSGLWDGHRIDLPDDLPEGQYDLVVGWYDWETGERLPLAGEAGNQEGDEYVLGPVTVDRMAGPRPDVACLAAPDSCASLE
jgi:uncharacterized membrane protein